MKKQAAAVSLLLCHQVERGYGGSGLTTDLQEMA